MRLFPVCVVPALMAALVIAEVPTPLLLDVDGDLGITAVYPLEVKYGSWARAVFRVTAFRELTVLKLRVRLILVYERGSAVLADRVLLENESMAAGERRDAALRFRASIPTATVEPFIEMRLTLEYAVNGSTRHIEYKAPIALVPRQTYAELRRQLEEARRNASLVDELVKELESLKLRLANESGRCSALSEQLEALSAEAASLREEVGNLRAEAALLRDRISRLEEENRRLRAENSALREERSGLSSKLASMQDSYELLIAQMSELRKECERLAAESSALKIALVVAAVLASALSCILAYQWVKRRAGRREASAVESSTEPPSNPHYHPSCLLIID